MQSRTLEIGVGLFLLAGLLALLLLALRVSGLSAVGSGDTYRLYAYFDNVAGLTPRAKVTMAGVTIGKVVAVDLDKERYTGRVTLEVDRAVDNLPTDSTASILTAGLLGEKYIGISVGGEEEVLREGGEIRDTQSALVLEDLIGKFLLNTVNKEGQ
ncbi:MULTISPECIES: outer membrane lipid asymmetry maintenance protein MlaD [Pseudomonas]|uniref:Organic solvent ABC transporter substrate-binding protein n=1 Tax=Pseudomonas flexibilis TaxID=706570 RepID=A0A0B2D4M4_9PSED|nr:MULTISPECIES: outer membrane lipid asymmetry maintenance protein MlaD [Pseudomonas]KHL69608.1 toluene tolerance ABC transporter substrate-binding protein [Pseudomonas flexibilis]KHO65152.1 organic solvent ABC transporter substrate-binding protein [Pseudomonas flexibilis]SCY41921.1 phospholipid/cholesterol/gamma-HCH transport system substrate-binding protein [Pseudomonas flexibilis]SIQ44095.1 phospholipid/cholesterol/gamma-HCH transport system substrate-binding protein [Pseudomonas flexibilis